MASIKLHLYSNEDPGIGSCDYRGQGELKGNHKTLLEKEFGEKVHTNDLIEKALLVGPMINQFFVSLGGNSLGLRLRLGVFDR